MGQDSINVTISQSRLVSDLHFFPVSTTSQVYLHNCDYFSVSAAASLAFPLFLLIENVNSFWSYVPHSFRQTCPKWSTSLVQAVTTARISMIL